MLLPQLAQIKKSANPLQKKTKDFCVYALQEWLFQDRPTEVQFTNTHEKSNIRHPPPHRNWFPSFSKMQKVDNRRCSYTAAALPASNSNLRSQLTLRSTTEDQLLQPIPEL